MKIKLFIILIVISILLEGCTLPEVSVLYLTDKRFEDRYVNVENSYYRLEGEYNLLQFSERIKNKEITYVEITTRNNQKYAFKNVFLRDSSLICENCKDKDSISIKEVKYINFFRASTKEEKGEGCLQVFCCTFLGLVSDLTNSKNGEKTFHATAIGAAVGLVLGSFFFFDYNKPSERIYVKKD